MKRWSRKAIVMAVLGCFLFLCSAGSASGAPRAQVLNGRIVQALCVNPGGTGGCVTSISAAVAKINRKFVTIAVASGTYHDNISINTGSKPKPFTLSITGTSGATATVIDGDAAGAVFTIGFKARVTLTGLTITDGTGGSVLGGTGGGGILVDGATLIVNACVVDGNDADFGAGIYAIDGNLTIDNSSITSNLGQGNFAEGGGIYFTSKRSHRRRPYKLTIIDSTIDSNSATFGGGVSLAGWGLPIKLSAEIIDSVISTNVSSTTAGAAAEGADLRSSFAKLTITNATISGNNAAGVMGRGGATLTLLCDVTLNNVTIANNSAGGVGGGIAGVFGAVIRANAAEIDRLRFVISNSIVAGNHAPESPDCEFPLPITSHDYNLIGDPTGCRLRNEIAHNIYFGDPMLGALMNNGGATDTQAPLPGSPALGAGNPGVPNGKDGHCAATDQIGTARSKGDCDMGAYQLPD